MTDAVATATSPAESSRSAFPSSVEFGCLQADGCIDSGFDDPDADAFDFLGEGEDDVYGITALGAGPPEDGPPEDLEQAPDYGQAEEQQLEEAEAATAAAEATAPWQAGGFELPHLGVTRSEWDAGKVVVIETVNVTGWGVFQAPCRAPGCASLAASCLGMPW